MRRSSLLRLGLLVQCTLFAMGQSYRIAGTVVRAADGTPVRHVHLIADLVPPPGSRDTASSSTEADADDEGRFSISVSAPGTWKLTGTARGYETSAFDAHDNYFTGIVLTPKSPTAQVTLNLIPEGSISGYISDEVGDPVRTNAEVRLLAAASDADGSRSIRWETRRTTRTDDRGWYEFTGLPSGLYQVMVQAQPWYAAEAPHNVPSDDGSQAPSPLDVTYPLTWYPGATDASSASTISLEGGEQHQADIRLLPVPSAHVRLSGSSQNGGMVGPTPQIRLLLPDGETSQVQTWVAANHQARDISGLPPGTYELGGRDGEQPSLLHIGLGAPRTLDLNAAEPAASIRVIFDLPPGASQPEVEFLDSSGQVAASTHRENVAGRPGFLVRGENFAPWGGVRAGRAGLRFRRTPALTLPAGRYTVRLAGQPTEYLTGMAATGATVQGHTVTVSEGGAELTLHIAAGHADLQGVANRNAAPSVGAMVLLVPAMLDDPQSFATIRRAQTNTDGSFQIDGIIPGRYILVAIDHGWQINWRDATTLDQYLIHGIPLDLTTASSRQEAVQALAP